MTSEFRTVESDERRLRLAHFLWNTQGLRPLASGAPAQEMQQSIVNCRLNQTAVLLVKCHEGTASTAVRVAAYESKMGDCTHWIASAQGLPINRPVYDTVLSYAVGDLSRALQVHLRVSCPQEVSTVVNEHFDFADEYGLMVMADKVGTNYNQILSEATKVQARVTETLPKPYVVTDQELDDIAYYLEGS